MLHLIMNVWVCHAGHNGLVSAAYLQKSGIQTCVLEKRHVVGGAAVTEEIVPGFKFSRASYLLSLLRPHIYSDLELKVFMHHMFMGMFFFYQGSIFKILPTENIPSASFHNPLLD